MKIEIFRSLLVTFYGSHNAVVIVADLGVQFVVKVRVVEL